MGLTLVQRIDSFNTHRETLTTVNLYVGTSGFSYDQWKGPFYPEDLPSSKMLGYYATQLSTVEINNTFYRMPTPKTVLGWGAQVPDSFRFSLKAPQRITHRKAFEESAENLEFFFKSALELKEKLGPVLFQFPPWLKKDLAKLKTFLGLLPKQGLLAMEFRHDSWFDEETYAALKEAGIALVLSETDEASPQLLPTGPFGYLRLRKTAYADGELKGWADRVASQPWKEAFVFFKHEDEGKGPAYAKEFIGLSRAGDGLTPAP